MARSRPVQLVGLLLLVATCAAALWGVHPRVGDAQTPVDLARLKAYVARVADGPHPVESEDNARVRDFLLAELRGIGLKPVVQTGRIRDPLGRDRRVVNLFCRIEAVSPGDIGGVLVTTHYDSKPRAPGAGDAGAGVASLMEIARLLRKNPPLRREVVLLFTDGEEAGLLGAQSFIDTHPDLLGCEYVLNFDARGTAGPCVMFETCRLTPALLTAYAEASPQPVTTSLADEVYHRLPNGTDFTLFAGAGMSGLNFAFFDGFENYHTPGDTPEALSDASLLHQASQAYALTRALGDGDPPADSFRPMVWFDLLGLVVIRYDAAWAMPLALLCAGTVVSGALRLRVRSSHLARSAGKMAIEFIGIVGWVHLLTRLPITKSFHAWTPHAFGAIALLMLAAVFWRPRCDDVRLAALLFLLAVLSLLVTLVIPTAGYVFVIPALLVGVAAHAEHRRPLALTLAAAGCTLILLPLAWLVTVALTLKLAAAGAAVLLLLAWIWRAAIELSVHTSSPMPAAAAASPALLASRRSIRK